MSRAEILWKAYEHLIRSYHNETLEQGMIIKTTEGEFYIIGDLTINNDFLETQGCGCCAGMYYKWQIDQFIKL